MPPVLYRRNSMASLSLYDLDAWHEERNKKLPIETIVTKSVLEDLPNELLIEIVRFLSPYDLHRGFYNLNLRLNIICEDQKFSLDLDRSKLAFDYYFTHQQPFASHIYSLNLSDTYNRLTSFNRYIEIEIFTNLRMLTIREPSSENLDTILSKLHTLPYLSYLNIRWALIQSSSITTAIFQIRTLKSLMLYCSDPIILHIDETSIRPFTQLEYLEVDSCSVTEFFELLKYVGPNVQRMKVAFLYQRQEIDPLLIDELLTNAHIPVTLRRIEMRFYFLSLTNLHSILRLFPHLIQLKFVNLTEDLDFISPSIWQEFISTNLLELTKLQFYMEMKGLLTNMIQCPSAESIDLFYSMNNQWLVDPLVMDYNSSLKSPVLELYTSSQSARSSKYSLELFGRKRYIATPSIDTSINIDKNITTLRITLTDNQQMPTTTASDQLSIDETNITYPKVTRITIHSQVTGSVTDNNQNINTIICDTIKSIPDLSKVTALNFTTDSSTFPSTTLARRLLDKLPKVSRLELSYDYLLYLLNSPLIVKLFTKKIDSLTIEFSRVPPTLPDMIRILNVFATKLRYLYFSIRMDFPANKFYFILPSLFSESYQKLSTFRLRLYTRTRGQPQVFDDQFKARLKNCLNAQVEKNKNKSNTMEYRIKDNEFSISF